MNKEEFSQHLARQALAEMRRVGLGEFNAGVVMDLHRVAEGDWPLMCDGPIKQAGKREFITVKVPEPLNMYTNENGGVYMPDGTPLPHVLGVSIKMDAHDLVEVNIRCMARVKGSGE